MKFKLSKKGKNPEKERQKLLEKLEAEFLEKFNIKDSENHKQLSRV